ncbi:MAG: hypothetical protein ABIG87_02045 [Patescibacteria group bacterium]
MFFLNKKNLHHAYLLVGEKEKVLKELLLFLETEVDFKTKANPDFYLEDFDSFGIDDGRKIKDFQSKKAIRGEKKIIVIRTNFITVEAQNSFLKIFEEPTENTHFFLILSSAETLLPTLKSRLMIIKNIVDEPIGIDLDVQRPSESPLGHWMPKLSVEVFLTTDIAKRFELIKVFLPKKKGEKADRAGAILFLNDLERLLYKNYKEGGGGATASPSPRNPQKVVFIFEEIIKCRSYLNDRSPSVKMILEHLSQIIPFISPH